ncbi:hypothetical protein ACMYSQ_002521 [Aspergillus niger]
MKFRRAAHRLETEPPSVLLLESVVVGAGACMLDICAIFFANRSRSSRSSFSRRFIAPGLCCRVFCLMILTCLLGSVAASSASGSASANESRAASFLEARRRFVDFWEFFSILDTKLLCLIKRLSFFVVRNSSWRKLGLDEGRAPFPLAGFLIERVGAYSSKEVLVRIRACMISTRGKLTMMGRDVLFLRSGNKTKKGLHVLHEEPNSSLIPMG